MKLYEMEGFLRGQCLPGDLLVGESNAEYLVRKLNEASTLKAERDALEAKCKNLEKQISHINTQSLEGALKMADAIKVLEDRVNALAVESVELRHIAERIVNALYAAGYEPEENSLHPWKSLIFDAEKALNTPVTDAALAAIQAQGVEKFAAQQEQLAADYRKLSPGCYGETSSAENALMARDFAAELREAK